MAMVPDPENPIHRDGAYLPKPYLRDTLADLSSRYDAT